MPRCKTKSEPQARISYNTNSETCRLNKSQVMNNKNNLNNAMKLYQQLSQLHLTENKYSVGDTTKKTCGKYFRFVYLDNT